MIWRWLNCHDASSLLKTKYHQYVLHITDSQIFLKMNIQILKLLYRDGEQQVTQTSNVQQITTDLLLILLAVVSSIITKFMINARKNRLLAPNIQFVTAFTNGLKIIVLNYGRILMIKATELFIGKTPQENFREDDTRMLHVIILRMAALDGVALVMNTDLTRLNLVIMDFVAPVVPLLIS